MSPSWTWRLVSVPVVKSIRVSKFHSDPFLTGGPSSFCISAVLGYHPPLLSLFHPYTHWHFPLTAIQSQGNLDMMVARVSTEIPASVARELRGT